MRKSIRKNYIYNIIYQIFLIIVPIVVTPYIARTLGEEASGKYSYLYSITTYFVLFAGLGFNTYAQRLVASHQGNRKQQSIDFWEIIIARAISVGVTSLIYYFFILGAIEEDVLILKILFFNIVAVFFDISFFFQANEEFGKLVLRNFFVKITSIICIFLLVKDCEDLWIYALIQTLSVLLGNILLWSNIFNYIKYTSLADIQPLRHIKKTVVLFLPTVATAVYTTLDKILIGIFTKNDAENGNYEYAEKLVKMSMTVLTSLGSVMIPRNTKLIEEGRKEEVVKNIYSTVQYVFLIGIPLCSGMIIVSDILVPWYLGIEYTKAALLIKVLSPLILIIGLSNVFGWQYLIPSGQDKKFTKAIFIGAMSNFSLNLFLIPRLQSVGAAIATVIAELIVTIVMMYFIKDDFVFIRACNKSFKYWISSMIMIGPCYFLSKGMSPTWYNTIFIAVLGMIIYFSTLWLLNDMFFVYNIKNIYKIFQKKFSKED